MLRKYWSGHRKILNEYDFIKTKVKGGVCDERSNFVRLLGQLIFEQENVDEEAIDGFKGRKYILMTL